MPFGRSIAFDFVNLCEKILFFMDCIVFVNEVELLKCILG